MARRRMGGALLPVSVSMCEFCENSLPQQAESGQDRISPARGTVADRDALYVCATRR